MISMFAKTQQELNRFAKYVIKQARTNLSKGKKNASKQLYNSLDYDLSVSKNSFSLEFIMAEYGMFVDEGVQGSKSSYLESRNSRFEFSGRFKTIPTKSIDKWVIRRGIKGVRDEKGRFIKRDSLKYLIAKSIYEKGIRASLFFTKPFEKAFDNLPKELIDAYALDIDEFFEFTT
jgi:hypothetical protein